jgi:predicted Zn-dependent protease
MKRLLLPLFLFLSACSSTPPRTLPPVIDGRTGEMVQEPDSPAPPESEPALIPVPQKPARSGGAVVALLGQADRYRSSGDSSNEAATIERALRIEPNNARLWSRLSAIRLEQGRPQQTEQLALKSNALATGDRRLQATNWRLIARARWALNDSAGAHRAERKASDLGG